MFPDSLTFFQAELARLDLILHRQILRLRARYQLSLDEFRGLYISDDQVDRLIDGLAAADRADLGVVELTQRIEAARRHNAANTPPDLPWRPLVEKLQFERARAFSAAAS